MEDNKAMDRAWVEINLTNLKQNVKEIQKRIPAQTKIMAVVKANAYGHGMIPISRTLNQIGITDFAVATLQEGITLRENGIKGNILILGYTPKERLQDIIQYDLIQTVVDENHAKEIADLSFGKQVKVHLKINTGMNRIGISYQNYSFIKNLYLHQEMKILGIFSHLCVSDSDKNEDILFSQKQIEHFNNLITSLKKDGIDVGKTHLQSSYGIINYPEVEYDYVRPGLFLFGVHEREKNYCKISLKLKPVLTLKARIASIREIDSMESVSYGREYIATKKEKIADVTIGYADGFPRNLSSRNINVLVNNQPVPIIGKICMDQLVINVSTLKQVKVGDIVTFIGENSPVKAEQIAEQADTITNELFTRLGSRLSYLYREEEN